MWGFISSAYFRCDLQAQFHIYLLYFSAIILLIQKWLCVRLRQFESLCEIILRVETFISQPRMASAYGHQRTIGHRRLGSLERNRESFRSRLNKKRKQEITLLAELQTTSIWIKISWSSHRVIMDHTPLQEFYISIKRMQPHITISNFNWMVKIVDIIISLCI